MQTFNDSLQPARKISKSFTMPQRSHDDDDKRQTDK